MGRSDIVLREFRPGDVPAAQALTAGFGWPHRVEDWAGMAALGHGLVAERDGGLAGTAMAWEWGGVATIGLIGVAAGLQGHGLGRRLFQGLLAGLEGRSLMLHATQAGMALYASCGFRASGRVTQYQGVLAVAPAVPALPGAYRLRAAHPGDLPALVAMDLAATGLDRAALLPQIGARGVVLEAAGQPTGFALIRRFGRGLVIGPAAAPDGLAAQAMIATLMQPCIGRFVRIDVPDETGLGPWLLDCGLADAGPVVRMERGPMPPNGPFRVMVLAGQAFG